MTGGAVIAVASLLALLPLQDARIPPPRIKVMTLDLGGDAQRSKLPNQERLARAQKILEEFPADIVFIARDGGVAAELATAVHRIWIPLAAPGAGLITSLKPAPAQAGELWRGLGAKLIAAQDREVIAFPLQFPFMPYQPYQVSGVAHDGQPFINSAEAACDGANATRGLLCEQLAVAVRAANAAGLPVCAAGMVNEPSAADWNDAAVRAELCPMRVAWPSIGHLERAGLRDAYRTVHPRVADAPGVTWPTIALKRDRSDRIDFVFVNARLECQSIEVLGEAGAASAKNPRPLAGGLPGEHRVIRAEFEWRDK